MASIGEAFIDVHANTLPFNREIGNDLNRIADDAEGGLDRTGKNFGEKITKSTVQEIGRRGKEFGSAVERATRNVVIQVRNRISFDRIRESIRRVFRRDVGRDIEVEIGDAFDRAGRGSGGIFSRFSQGIADAIGAGFNVSGRSPLIAILLPALLALVGVIVAAVQAVNALIAVLVILPSLLTGIIAQFGLTVLAFQGMGEAIQGAFNATNAKELNEAIKNLTPSAQSFVKSLLPLEGLFKMLQRIVQENFFRALGSDIIQKINTALSPTLIRGFGQLARDLGLFFRDLALFFASPTFVEFVSKILPATGKWLNQFGPAFVKFITGLLDMANAAMPFLDAFGTMIASNLGYLGDLFSGFAKDPAFQRWLEDMEATLISVFELLGQVIQFIFVFLRELNRAGGKDIIDEMATAFERLSFLLASPVGQKAMEGLVNLSIFGIQSFMGLVMALVIVFAAFEKLGEYLTQNFLPDVMSVIMGFGNAVAAFGNFFAQWVGRIITGIGNAFITFGNFLRDLWNRIFGDAGRFTANFSARIGTVIGVIRALPGHILSAVANFGNLLWRAGASLVEGLVRGIQARVQWLRDWARYLASIISGFFGFSPAKEGPLSGKGYMLFRGQHIVEDLAKGIEMEIPRLRNVLMEATSSIVFGANSVQVNVGGPMEDTAQARTFGAAMGVAAANQIAARNTRLAVRTL